MALVSRRFTRPLPLPQAASEPAPIPTFGAGDSVGVRQVMVAGDEWRVMVQCWQRGNRWVGRLVFVGPGGQAWMEEGWSVAGRSAWRSSHARAPSRKIP